MERGNDELVKVAVRQRPLDNGENCDTIKYQSDKIILIEDRPYNFDFVFGPEITQKDVFDSLIDPLVEKVMQGFNCTAFAYGQTGTGKSYTMGLNIEEKDSNKSGVIPRSLWKLMENISDFELSVSFVEIYNEKAYDLLASDKVPMTKGLKMSNSVRKKISSFEDCDEILKKGNVKRHVRPTTMNTQSSRSHAIFSIEVLRKNSRNPVRSYLNLIDLAGSEGVRRTGHIGEAMIEGVHINQSLLCIGNMLQAISVGRKVIPYRDSVLGSVLQDSFNLKSYVTFLACISAKRIDLSETLSTIRFAERAKKIKKTPEFNSVLKEMNKIKSKTPYHRSVSKYYADPTPFKDNNLNQIKENFVNASSLRKTCCTPRKETQKAPRRNLTEIGLTPKEKKKAEKRLMESYSTNQSCLPEKKAKSNIVTSTARETTFEQTTQSWNVNTSSSSTGQTLTSTTNTMSFSPIIKKCMEKFETVLDNKVHQLVENISSANTFTYNTQKEFSNKNEATPQFVILQYSELKAFMSEVLYEKEFEKENKATSTPKKTKLSLFRSSPLFKVPEIQNKATSTPKKTKSSLFGSSPLFKVPEIPVNRIFSETTLSDSTNSIQPTIELTDSDTNTFRRCRYSLRMRQFSKVNNAFNNNCETEQIDLTIPTPPLKKKKSIELLQDRRRSIRTATQLARKKLKGISKVRIGFENGIFSAINNSKLSKKLNKTKHQKEILELLNKGSMEDLQVLPQIGKKRAFQLKTQRDLEGEFRTLADVEKLPIWRGSAWERFAEANLLL